MGFHLRKERDISLIKVSTDITTDLYNRYFYKHLSESNFMVQQTKKLVSIVIPAYNEETTIGLVLRDLLQQTKKLSSSYRFEIIVSYDEGTDKTKDVILQFPVILSENTLSGSKGGAMRHGFAQCKGEWIIMLDADYSHRLEDLPKFLDALEKGAMLVVGSRKTGGSDEYTGVRGIGNELLTGVFRVLWGLPMTDVLNGYKAFRRCVIGLPLHSPGFEIELELIKNALVCGGPVVEVESHESARAGGEMKSHAIREGYRFLMGILKNGLIYRYHQLKK
jgi:glycosyltransferase involved in cell wall biosynthesis